MVHSIAGEKMSLEKMRLALEGQPTIEELCALPVEKVWHQLGLWLGVEEHRLQGFIRWPSSSNKVKSMFEYFLKAPCITEKYTKFLNSLTQDMKKAIKKFFTLLYSEQLKSYQDVVGKLNEVEKKIMKEVFQQIKQQREELIMALVKVGSRDVAEKICQSKGLSDCFTCTVYYW